MMTPYKQETFTPNWIVQREAVAALKVCLRSLRKEHNVVLKLSTPEIMTQLETFYPDVHCEDYKQAMEVLRKLSVA